MSGSKEKKERSLGVRLQLKGERCMGPKCVMVRRPSRPGVHGASFRRKSLSEFGRQVHEKQKFKVSYGLDDRNLKLLFEKATRRTGNTAGALLEFLERRLDNVVFLLGFAPSRGAARQLVVHGHVTVNGKRVKSPGFQLNPKDVVGVRAQSQSKTLFTPVKESLKKREVPSWLELSAEKLEGRVKNVPDGVESPKFISNFEINLLVESFSK
jgi:small subunit ribosomal protein S4